jgi:hypothetical protein
MGLTQPSSSTYLLSEKSLKRFPIYPVGGILSTALGTIGAVYFIPDDYYPEGSLFLSAVVMTCGLLAMPVYASIRNPKNILRAEHILLLSPIYWLLLELIQSAYPMEHVSRGGIEGAFWMTGLFVCGVWCALLTSPLKLPRIIGQSASYDFEAKTLFKLILLFFSLGILRFAYPCDFNPVTMFDALTKSRWAAPWSRGQFGGWDAFLDHMSYFGYLVPTLTALLVRKVRVLIRRL